MGKTTLWRHALHLATSSGGHVLSTRPSEADLALGFGGLADLLTPFADVWMSQIPQHLEDALASALMLVSPAADHDRLAVLRGAQLALEAVAATAGCLAIGIDDVQWLDPASAQAISYMLRRWSGPPIGLVVTWRDGTDEPLGLPSLPGNEWIIEVGPLSAGDIRRLVARRVATGVSGSRLEFLSQVSGGNPFYALELARTAEGVSVPRTLQMAASQRLSAARPASRGAIELAAVVGPSPEDLYVDQRLTASLDAAVEDRILTVDGLVRFDHPLLAWAAYEQLPPRRRRQLHKAAAGRSGSVEERASHLARATDEPDEVVAALLDEAGRLAVQRNAVEAAARFAEHAARLTAPGDDQSRARRLADVAWYYSDWDEELSAAAADRVLELGLHGPDRGRALLIRA
jgi:hypothetical protein